MTHERFDSPLQFDMEVQRVVLGFSPRGILIDEGVQAEYHSRFHSEWENLQAALNVVCGYELNVNSPKQVGDFLYKDCKLPIRKKEGKVTSNEDAIRALQAISYENAATASRDETKARWTRAYIALSLILKIRSTRKLISSYIDIDIDTDGRIRTNLSVGGARNWRFTASKTLWGTGCNLQTIPRKVRNMMRASPGYELAEFDLNRGESWVYAHLADDPEMIRIHQTGADFHAETASGISIAFGEPRSVDWIIENKETVAYKLRYLGKRVNHASAYRMGPFRLTEVVNSESEETGISIVVSKAREAQALWQAKYSRMPQWWVEIENELAQNNRTLVSPYGRVRQFFGFWGKELFKEATSWIPSSTSVDYLNLGMLDFWNNLDSPDVRLLHQNHDSILIEYKQNLRDEIIPATIDALSRSLVVNGYTISIPVEANYGPSWGELEQWKSHG